VALPASYPRSRFRPCGNLGTTVVFASALVLTAGCVDTVVGAPLATRDPSGVVGVGPSIVKVLPTDAELSAALRDDMSSHGISPTVGGIDALPDGVRNTNEASEIQCLGVVHPYMRKVYENSMVRAAATRSWDDFDDTNKHLGHWYSVRAGALALASPADAQALFGAFVQQWQQCRGKTMTVYHAAAGSSDERHQITDVRASDTMLTAVVLMSQPPAHATPSPVQRAVGVAMNCIADVDFSDSGWRAGDAVSPDQAAAVTQLMLSKITGAT